MPVVKRRAKTPVPVVDAEKQRVLESNRRYSECFRRESAEVEASLDDYRDRLSLSLDSLTSLVGLESWDDLEEMEVATGDVSMGVPPDLIRRIVTAPGGSKGDYRWLSDADGPYYGIRRRGSGHCLHIYGESGGSVDWDIDTYFDEERWRRALDAWRRDCRRNLGGHYHDLLEDEFVPMVHGLAGPMGREVVLSVPTGLLRELLSQPGRTCPGCMTVHPMVLRFELAPRGTFSVWHACPECSQGRSDRTTMCYEHGEDVYYHRISRWKSRRAFADPERIGRVWDQWIQPNAGENP